MNPHENLNDVGEFGLIARLQQRLARRAGVQHGIGDDAAVLAALQSPVVTCDALVEGIHFRRDWTTPRLLGRKAISVNVSDIAAMGGRPVAAVVTLGVAANESVAFIEELYAGLEATAALYELTIAGGDTTRLPSGLLLSVTVIGEAPQPILRSGARPGDVLIATGTLGDAAAGLALLQNPDLAATNADREYLLQRHHDPTARVREMQAALTVAASEMVISAALDLSDGVAGDAAHLARRSAVTLEIESDLLPLSTACRNVAAAAGVEASEWALRGGEDYELLLCARAELAAAVVTAIEQVGTAATIIGRCIAHAAHFKPDSVLVRDANGRRSVAPSAWTHF